MGSSRSMSSSRSGGGEAPLPAGRGARPVVGARSSGSSPPPPPPQQQILHLVQQEVQLRPLRRPRQPGGGAP